MMKSRWFISFTLKISITLSSVRSAPQLEMLKGLCEAPGRDYCKIIDGRCEPESNKCVCGEDSFQSYSFICIPARKLGESCTYNAQCQYNDINSYCGSPTGRLYDMLKCICKPNYSNEIVNSTKRCTAPLARKLGESCTNSAECQYSDINSYCGSPTGRLYSMLECICKPNYIIEIVNSRIRCTAPHARNLGVPHVDEKSRNRGNQGSVQEIQERLRAAFITFCFLGCLIVVSYCVRKKHQAAELQHQQASTNNTPTPSRQSSFGSMALNLHDTHTLSNESCSPPPYNSVDIPNSRTSENEEPPPSYEEAIKNAERLQQGNS